MSDNLQTFADLEKQIKELMKPLNEFRRQKIEELKYIFKNEIKQSYLITILKMVRNEYKDIQNYYPSILNISPASLMMSDNTDMDYDICCHIVGIHKFNMMFVDDSKRGDYQKDPKYNANLCEQVYNHIKLRQFGSSFFRTKMMFYGDRFLYFPMGYDVFVAAEYIYNMTNTEEFEQRNLLNFFPSRLFEILSVLTLMENGLLMEAYPHARNLIELYFKYEVLKKNPDALEEYYNFCQYEIDYSSSNDFNENFLKKYEEHKEKTSKVDYLHFGWIDAIFGFNYLKKSKKYSIKGLYNYLKMMHINEESIDRLKKLHNACHMFSHGTTISRSYQLETYFELVTIIYNILKVLLKDACELMHRKPNINGINIETKMDNDWKTFCEKKKFLTEENVRKYYGIKQSKT